MKINLNEVDNIRYITILHRLILRRIRRVILTTPAVCKNAQENLDHYYERVISKKSLVSTLGEIANTELKIEKQRPTQPPMPEAEPPLLLELDERDQAIIDQFIARSSKEF